MPGVTGLVVADAVRASQPGLQVEYAETRADLVATVRGLLRPGDLCLTMGAGDLTDAGRPAAGYAAGLRCPGREARVVRDMAPAPRHRYSGGPPVDPRFRRRWAEARRAEGRRRLRVLVSLLCIMAVLGGVLGVLHSPLMRVRHVVVEGNVHTPAASVLAAADLMGRPATPL